MNDRASIHALVSSQRAPPAKPKALLGGLLPMNGKAGDGLSACTV